MPIIDLQRRIREIGRIRIGQTVRTGNGRGRPAKLESFRLTSRDATVIRAAADLWGGTAQTWDAPDGQQWEVITDTAELAVVVPPGDMAFSQWYEQWTAGGCKVRCDGAHDIVRDTACDCDPERRACSIHTRLSVMLPDLPGVGVWRLETHGYYAAGELAGVVELCQQAMAAGTMLPARLRLEQRRVVRDGKTNKFNVPTLDLDVHVGTLQAITTGAEPPAALAPRPRFEPVGELPEAPTVSIADQLAEVAEPKPKPTRRNAAQPMKSTGVAPRTAAEAGGPRLCTRCGEPLSGAAERDGDGYRHKTCGDEPQPLTDRQKAMHAKVGDLVAAGTWDKADAEMFRKGVISAITDGATDSSKGLTDDQLSDVLDALDAIAKGVCVLKLRANGTWSVDPA